MEKNSQLERKKCPFGLIGVSIVGIAVIVIMIIANLKHFKVMMYFGFFMNLLFYVHILMFALCQYKNEESLRKKKPVKGLLKSFIILLAAVTISFPPIIIPVVVIFGIVIILDIVIIKNIMNFRMCRILIFVVLALLLAAAIIKLGIYGHLPHGILRAGTWAFNVFNQVIQWTAFGMSYIYRFAQYRDAGYLD